MIAAVALLALPALGSELELELAGGIAHPLEGSPRGGSYEYPFAAPTVQARAALNLAPRLSVGAMFLAVIGGEAENRTACCNVTTGHQAFSATATLLTLRLRSSGPVQFWAEGGLGTGHLISLQTNDAFEHPPLRGHAGVAFRAAAGVRYAGPDAPVLGAEVAWLVWTNVEHGPGGGNGSDPAQYGLTTSALLLLVSVGVALGL
jgi:hypothetical protein